MKHGNVSEVPPFKASEFLVKGYVLLIGGVCLGLLLLISSQFNDSFFFFVCGFAMMLYMVRFSLRVHRQRESEIGDYRVKNGLCRECGYDLRWSLSPNCPECGATITRNRKNG